MEAVESYTQAGVGLRDGRPFRICTIHYGTTSQHNVLAGDEPQAHITQSVELSYKLREEAYTSRPHSHEFYEMALIREGSIPHLTEEGEETLRRGDVVLVTPGAVHAYGRMSGVLKTNFYIQPEWLYEELRLLWGEPGLIRHMLAEALFRPEGSGHFHRARTNETDTLRWESELQVIEHEVRQEKPSQVLVSGCFLKILAVLNEAFLEEHGTGTMPVDRVVWEAAERIEERIRQGRHWNEAEVARAVGAPASSFGRHFRDATGMTPSDYYQHRRVQHAARLLTEPSATVTETARELGYADVAHLSRVFKRLVGKTPRQYQKERAISWDRAPGTA